MKDYTALLAGMRIKPTFDAAEEVIKKDFKVKLPDLRYIHMWNTPEISQFRGVQETIDKVEVNRQVVERERMDIRHVAAE